MGKLNEGMFSSNDQKWSTPQDLFDKLNSVFNFDIDLAAADDTAKCEKYYTEEDDAFQYEWNEKNAYINPPYGRYQIKWIERASEQSKKYNNTIVMLIPARPDTKAWQNVIFKSASTICFIKGRLKFSDRRDSAPFPSALIVFGEINKKQLEVLNDLGKTFNNSIN